MSTAHGVSRTSHERTGGSTRKEQRTDDERKDAENGRAGSAEQQAEQLPESTPGRTTVRSAQCGQQSENCDGEAGAKRSHVDELAPRDHQRTDGDKRDWSDVRAGADHRADRVGEPAADTAA